METFHLFLQDLQLLCVNLVQWNGWNQVRRSKRTVKASNFGPDAIFGHFLASSVASLDEICTTNEQSCICKSSIFLTLPFSSFFCRTRFDDSKPFLEKRVQSLHEVQSWRRSRYSQTSITIYRTNFDFTKPCGEKSAKISTWCEVRGINGKIRLKCTDFMSRCCRFVWKTTTWPPSRASRRGSSKNRQQTSRSRSRGCSWGGRQWQWPPMSTRAVLPRLRCPCQWYVERAS